MSRTSYNDPNHAHFLTFSCHRKQQFLTDSQICEFLAESIEFARMRERFHLWAYVFMPEHVHLLIHPLAESYAIGKILRRIKEPVTHRVVAHWRDSSPHRLEGLKTHQGRRTIHRLWLAGGGFDRNLTDADVIVHAINYIEFNPVRRRLVSEATDWMWSSARARAGMSETVLGIDLPNFGEAHANPPQGQGHDLGTPAGAGFPGPRLQQRR